VDLFELGREEKRAGISDPRGAIFRWLDILHERVPGAVVALVGTHGDLFFPLPCDSEASSELEISEDQYSPLGASDSLMQLQFLEAMDEMDARFFRQQSTHSSRAVAAQDTKDDDGSVNGGDDGHVQ
ncbi:unnamed protein product, partial [Pylaiella littoralis]